MRGYYAARAPEYDAIYRKPERQADLRAIEAWLPTLFTGASVLEVACGTGYWTQFLAPVATRLLALDAAPETLAIARARVPQPTVTFATGDAYALPRDAGPFQAAFAGFWLSHVPKARVRDFLLGLHALLEPGATVVLLDNRLVPGSSTPISRQDADGNTYQQRPLADGTAHEVLKNFPTEADLRAATQGLCSRFEHRTWPHYWALAYRVA